MGAHNFLRSLFEAPLLKDPGNGQTIYLDDKSLQTCLLVSTGAETRTLAAPMKAGAWVALAMKTDGGDITLTVTGGYNEDGDTSFVFSDPGQFIVLLAVSVSGTLTWRKVADYGLGNIAPADAAVLDELSGLTATADEINRVADPTGRIVNCTASTLAVTEALHDGRIITLNRAAGIAVTLPTAAAGLRFRFIVGTTFTGAASIKSVSGADIMIGHALMGNDSDNSVVDWQALAASTYDTIDLFGTANSTGGIAGQEIEIIGLAANLWFVSIRGDAAGTEATPFADTVA